MITRIIRLVSSVTGLSEEHILGPSKSAGACRARYAIAWLLRQWTGLGYAEIASCLRRTCHGTAMHAVRTAAALMASDATFRATIETCTTRATA